LQVDPSGISKTKSKSVSKETETCILVIENAWPEPQAIFGADEVSLLTCPWMHLAWKPSRENNDRFEKELLQEKPEKSKPPKESKDPVGSVDQSKPDCWSWVQLLLVLEGLEKLLALPQLSPAACCVSRAVAKKALARVAFMLAMLTNGIVAERGKNTVNECLPAHWTGSERKTFPARLTEKKQRKKRKYLKM
jgi:hypothetical protein